MFSLIFRLSSFGSKVSVEIFSMMSEVSEGESVTLGLLKQKMADFAKERDWDRFHSPRNLLLALVCLSCNT